MKNRKNIKNRIWIAGAIIFLGLCVYSVLLPPLLLPRNEALPDREIVFRYWDDRGKGYVGFIDPDGSGFETRDVIVPTGWFNDGFVFKRYTTWLHRSVRWSESGDAIGLQCFRNAPVNGIPFLIDLNGKFTFCPEKSTPTGLYNGGIVFLGDDKIVSIRDDITHKKDEVVVYDMQTCQEVETIYTAEEGEYLREAPISKTGRIALWHYVNKQNQVTILLPDKTVQAVFEDATQPAWSKDGEYLAFVKPDGLYIVTKDGNNLERVLEAPHIDCPSWGPDGDKLVMEHPRLTIAVLDLTSGEITEIVENGACPDWR